MKNLVHELPSDSLKGRLLQSVNLVKDEEIKGKAILDIGCGYGWFENNALTRGVKKICGIEITGKDLETVRKYIKDSRAEFKIGSAIKIPYKDNTFDTIVCWEVIEHIPKNTENKMFKEVRRVLKKGGTFYLSTPHDQIVSRFLDPAWWLIGHRHYSKRRLEQYGIDQGFSILEVRIKGKWWRLFSSLNMYFSKWILHKKPIFQDFFDHKEKLEMKQKGGFANIFVKYKKL